MARRSDRQIIEEMLERFEPQVRAAFLEAIEDIVGTVELTRFIEALRRGDIDAALRALHVEPAAFRRLEQAISSAFTAGGESMMVSLPPLRDPLGARVGIRFDPGDPRAAERVRSHGAQLVTMIVDDQMRSLRSAIAEGLEKGTNPRTVGIRIAGAIDHRTGRRAGGIIGLTNSQREFVEAARGQLASGNPADLRHYLERAARDRRFDATVRRAIASGQPVDAATIDRIIGRYNDSLLKMRADIVARTETMQAVNGGRDEAARQTMRDAGIDDDLIVRTWRSTPDRRTRETHRAMNGQQVRGFEDPFRSPSGALLRYPGDPMAPPSEVIQCRCIVTVSVRKPDQPV